MKPLKNNPGFTIMELLIFIFLFGIISTVVYTVFSTTQRTYAYNSKTVDLRQNLRASVDYMTGELMMAGNPGYNNLLTQKGLADTGFVKAARNLVAFTSDLNMDGTVTQTTFGLSSGSDADGDGLVDPAVETASLVRVIDTNPAQIITDDIQALQFAYAVDADGNKALDFIDTNGNGQADSDEVIWAYDSDDDGILDVDSNGVALATQVRIDKIKMVKIWVLGRTSATLKIPADTRTYQLGGLSVSGGNDRYKRFLLSTSVKLRNMGL